MKRVLLNIVCLCSLAGLQAQSSTGILGVNGLRIRLGASGMLADSMGAAALTTATGNGLLKNAGIWMTALDSADNIRSAAHNVYLNTHEFWAGPLQLSNEQASNTAQWNKVYAVSKSDIAEHRLHYKDLSYVPSVRITSWPGSAGFPYARVLAPFVDIDVNNQIYEPLSGDYPYVIGDACLYSIANDRYAAQHSYTKGLPLGVELHGAAYAFAGDSALKNCILLRYSVYNRSNRNYKDFRFSAALNFGIGQFDNDFLGTEIGASVLYAYNDTSEATFKGKLVSVGCMAINKPISSTMYFENTSDAINGVPDSAVHFRNLMSGIWKNGKPLNYGSNGVDGSGQASYVFPDTTDALRGGFRWIDQVPGTKVGLLNFAASELRAAQAEYYEMVLFYVEENNFNLKQIGQNCLKIKQALSAKNLLGLSPFVHKNNPDRQVYPNPLKPGEKLWVRSGLETPVGIRLFSLDGREVSNLHLDKNDNSIILPPDLNQGIYVLEYQTLNMVWTTKLILNH